MSGFEHYEHEFAELDHEIRRYAAVCGVDLTKRHELDACMNMPHEGWADDKARQSLRGLLILRLKLETEMLELGFSPPPFQAPPSGE